MPQTELLLYQDEDGTAPLLEWLEQLPEKAQDKCRVRLGRLAELGHELRLPEADYLRDGIYELRVGLNHVNYRMLYFFHGRDCGRIARTHKAKDRAAQGDRLRGEAKRRI